MEDGEEAEMDAEMGDELDLESVEYDLDEEIAEESDEVVEEATKLSDNVAAPKGGDEDSKDGMKMPAPTKVGKDVKAPVINDGSDGNKGDSAKDHTPTDNINVEPKKA